MGYLRVTSDHLAATFDLSDETAKVGRSRDNKIRLPHKSVSRHHAVVTEESGRLIVKDLASSYGTFINEDRVTEGHAEDGDVIRFGRVRVVYEKELRSAHAPVEAATPGPVSPPPSTAAAVASTEKTTDAKDDSPPAEGRPCDRHPGKLQSLVCPKCRLHFCEACVNKLEVSNVEKAYCPYCKEACKPLTLFQIAEDRRRARESRTFFKTLPDVLAHPFSAGAIPLLFIGTLLFLVLGRLGLYSAYAPIPILFYLAAYMHRIIATAAEGEDGLPGWPTLSDPWYEVIRPGLLVCLSGVIAFLPLIAYLWSVAKAGGSPMPSATFPLVAWALIYLPFSMLSVSVADDAAGANPLTVLAAFSRLHLQFMFAAALILFIVGIRLLITNLVAVYIAVPYVPELLSGFVTAYFVLMELRLLGVLYHTNRTELRWHED